MHYITFNYEQYPILPNMALNRAIFTHPVLHQYSSNSRSDPSTNRIHHDGMVYNAQTRIVMYLRLHAEFALSSRYGMQTCAPRPHPCTPTTTMTPGFEHFIQSIQQKKQRHHVRHGSRRQLPPRSRDQSRITTDLHR